MCLLCDIYNLDDDFSVICAADMSVEGIEILYISEFVHEFSVEIAFVSLALNFNLDFVPFSSRKIHRF